MIRCLSVDAMFRHAALLDAVYYAAACHYAMPCHGFCLPLIYDDGAQCIAAAAPRH